MSRKPRIKWGKERKVFPKLDLIELQRDSYQQFLDSGIRESLDEINGQDGEGIKDFTGKNWILKFGNYRLGELKHTPAEAKSKAVTYDFPLYVEASLTNQRTGATQTQEVFLADMPKMTNVGTFIVNGIERAVVTQLVRSPGAFFSSDKDGAQLLYKAELRPLRGSWLEIGVGKRQVLSVKIDRRRKMPATVLLRAMGYGSDEELMELFADEIGFDEHDLLVNTIAKDSTKTEEEALIELYEKMRPGEPAVLNTARDYLFQLFFDARRYDLGEVGRYKLNSRLKLDIKDHVTVLTKEDVISSIKYLIGLQNGKGKVDDIDHLSNRRLRRVGELVQGSAVRIGLIRLERSIREKMSLTKTDEVLTPAALVNARPLIATISEFFRRNRLSTILDQTNPLAEIDNLRRLSVMGSGGVTRERASFSMRDINASQYSRIDPVRSPEGPNIGLVTYLALFAHVNKFGFLEAPYLRVENRKGKMKVTDEIVYMNAADEEDHKITHAGVDIDDNGYITDDWVPIRYMNNFIEGSVEEVEYIDVIPSQVIGTSASLIPFIDHDEANRALMGTHMQCQAVPLIRTDAPIVGTGMEGVVACAMGRTVKAWHGGEVEYVDGNKVTIKIDGKELKKVNKEDYRHVEEVSFEKGKDIYKLTTFKRTAQSTSYSQRAIVKVGDKIKKGDVIIDGPSSDNGELALGSNLLIAYSSFEGLGYEDAIVISDRLVKDDSLTSVHISEYRSRVMDTKLGSEELTNDIPNVSESYLSNLTEDGIVRNGSVVASGDILVGKIAPKGETELSPEERLLRAIFGEKSREVRNTSLRLPHGTTGTVIDVQVLDREKGDELDPGTLKEVTVRVAETRKITVGDKLAGRHGNKGVISKIVPQADMPHLEDGTPIDIIISPLSVLARMNLGQLLEANLAWAAKNLGYNVAIPPFEQIDEGKIWDSLEEAGLPRSGKTQLLDGRTGEKFRESTVVGIGYILKLAHMVEDKVHARSTGPYSLVTQQPLGGKAQMGGQRMGEMEVWALEAHRAAHTLQEMLTIKSDDVKGRGRAFEAMVKGEEIPAPTVPESFKVLVRELNSLGLDVIPHEVEEQIEEVKPSAEATTDDAVATDDTTTDDDDTAATDDTTDDAVADDTADVKEEVEAVESTEEKLNTDTKEQE
ncbi:MAG: DNA-directed RNA polymerase subunit beta [Candidatus Pacebacteria bacterium]|jgi:DNA-directed RNA polymerase subunit beta|nr:DNA-directed RNA polymerase subunit beta [Candidatus Paceibacterota bacterium]MBT3511540.1 DNA-directed RNA polymerase subunit beta [Candidatus Paceibacterota bacterium]MBT4004990.1 DNA-directed RNA polymerase subunit beta [Candidatus Paceibacterota bacterium]MBT4680574.1 DNA-directed RNA polymerase subunit beta [Candidatus Paceibacterota bacterium]MBT6898463.1 DNA-directed RNA polymerase subunit beta [Candidatus Paceibacterota bacterium]